MHNLEELAVEEQWYSKAYSIACLVQGCPKLKVLHVGHAATIESVQRVLLGLPDLIEFKHPAMVVALENIIRSKYHHRVSALRNLYVEGNGRWEPNAVKLKTSAVVLKHLRNITTLDIREDYSDDTKALASIIVSVPKLLYLTNLTLHNFHGCEDLLEAAVKYLGHQFRLLDLISFYNKVYPFGEIFDRCRKIRVLRFRVQGDNYWSPFLGNILTDYGSKLSEEVFTPFPNLQELIIDNISLHNLKPAMFASLITSPALQHLELRRVSTFTDHVLEAALNYTDNEGEQLTFTSLRTFRMEYCNHISSKFLYRITDAKKVPLKSLDIQWCEKVAREDCVSWHHSQ